MLLSLIKTNRISMVEVEFFVCAEILRKDILEDKDKDEKNKLKK